jgi:hypothetical protein
MRKLISVLLILAATYGLAEVVPPPSSVAVDAYSNNAAKIFFRQDGASNLTGNVRLNGNWLSGDGGNEGVAVDTSGNVGVGIAAPTNLLHVAGSGSVNTDLIVGGQIRSGNAICQLTIPNGGTQVFTASSGFEFITNFTAEIKGDITATTTNFTTPARVTDLKVSVGFSARSSANNNVMDVHCFTNGATAARPGFQRSIGSAGVNQYGVVWNEYIFFDLPASVVVDFRMDVTNNSTLTWDHFQAIAEELM